MNRSGKYKRRSNNQSAKPPLKNDKKNSDTPQGGTTLNRFFAFSEAILRWGLIVVILCLLAGSLSISKTDKNTADQLASEFSELEHERAELLKELNNFSDPEWRAGYWKWRTKSHRPGEYYIDFP